MPPVIRLIPQRHEADCGVAVLATYLCVSYEEALIVVGRKEPAVLSVGLWMSEIVRAAKQLGVTLKRKPAADLDEDEGILVVTSPRWRHDHLVVLKNGLIFDTDAMVWEAETYLAANQAKPGMLLRAKR